LIRRSLQEALHDGPIGLALGQARSIAVLVHGGGNMRMSHEFLQYAHGRSGFPVAQDCVLEIDHDPCWSMVARVFLPTRPSVNTAVHEPVGQIR